jgi:hypothetical protein
LGFSLKALFEIEKNKNEIKEKIKTKLTNLKSMAKKRRIEKMRKIEEKILNFFEEFPKIVPIKIEIKTAKKAENPSNDPEIGLKFLNRK